MHWEHLVWTDIYSNLFMGNILGFEALYSVQTQGQIGHLINNDTLDKSDTGYGYQWNLNDNC